ncbi:pinin/SDK/memA/ protein conserved region-domain-containing protein [Globomyces pollinis-pini]|nr:pinin/SDK/memA/ protein conserved region-domain-containing protein [Globomyces pollinis-pini]
MIETEANQLNENVNNSMDTSVTEKSDRYKIEDNKRNQRLFGSLLGTLNKFKEDNGKKTEAEIKREQLERRLAEKLKKERSELSSKLEQDKHERIQKVQEKRKQEETERELKKAKFLKDHQEKLSHFILTTASPKLYFLPKVHNEKTKVLLNKVE